MDSLQEIIQHFSEEEIKQFRKYIKQKSKKEKRKDLLLLDFLRNNTEEKISNFLPQLYPGNNTDCKDAYHQLRKSLYNRIESFICSKGLESDNIHQTIVNVGIAKYYFSKKLGKQGWKHLKDAEIIATEKQLYGLQRYVLYLQIQNSFQEGSPEIMKIIEKRNNSLKNDRLNEILNIIYGLLRYDILLSNKDFAEFSFEQRISEYLGEYNISFDYQSSPQLQCEMLMAAVRALLEQKDFKKLEIFLVPRYNTLLEKNSFDVTTHQQKIKFLEILTQTHLYNKKYKIAEDYFNELKSELSAYDKKYYNFIVPYSTILSDIYYCTNRLDEGILHLSSLLSNPVYDLSEKDIILLNVNLAGLFFANDDNSKASKAMIALQAHDKAIFSLFGEALYLNKCISEMIIYYENGAHTYVDSRIKSIRRKFKKQLKTKGFLRENMIINLIKKINSNPYFVNEPEFINEVNNCIKLQKVDPSSMEIISFNAWFVSKIEKKEYYNVFWELLNK